MNIAFCPLCKRDQRVCDCSSRLGPFALYDRHHSGAGQFAKPNKLIGGRMSYLPELLNLWPGF